MIGTNQLTNLEFCKVLLLWLVFVFVLCVYLYIHTHMYVCMFLCIGLKHFRIPTEQKFWHSRTSVVGTLDFGWM